MESIELLIVGFILIGFIALTFYMTNAFGIGQQTRQAQLNVAAQQALQRIAQYPAYNVSRDLGLADPAAPGYLNDFALELLALNGSSFPYCGIDKNNPSSTGLAQAIGANGIYWIGYGFGMPGGYSANLNLDKIVAALFGASKNGYDVEVVVKPLIEAAICSNEDGISNANVSLCNTFFNLAQNTLGVCQQSQGLCPQGLYLVFRGTTAPIGNQSIPVFLNIYYCQQESSLVCLPPMAVERQLQFFSNGSFADFWISYANITGLVDRALRTNAGISLSTAMSYVAQGTAGLVVYALKLSYPYAATYYTANGTYQSLIFAVPVYTSGGIKLVLAHDGDYSCYKPGDLSTRIVESLYYYASSSNTPTGIVLDAGIGNVPSYPKSVPPCTACMGSSCTACYVDLPLDAELAVIQVAKQSSSPRGPSTAVIAVPLFPATPFAPIDVRTWYRWGWLNTPRTYAASAWGVYNSLTTTYLVNVTVYQYSSALK
ncbi:MAG: hypothetical protein JZD41_00380 [Thermoproteus sp.]|nr:hypothetical protein [Thermoproteus sp.]